jgi:hypothetical protein
MSKIIPMLEDVNECLNQLAEEWVIVFWVAEMLL